MKKFAFAALLAVSLSPVRADTPAAAPPVLSNAFEEDAGAWVALGATGKVIVTHEADSVKGGKGALKFNYSVAKGEMNALVLPTPDGALTKAKSLTFSMKAFVAMPVVIMLAEKGGGHYIAAFTLPAGQWQAVALSLADFALGTGKDDPKDPDGKLDMDAVESIAVADLSQLFVGAEGEAAALLTVKPGPRAFLLDDFAARAEPLPIPSADLKGALLLDPISHPQLPWIAVGDAALSRVVKGGGLQMAYHQAQGKLAGVFKGVAQGSLAGKTQIAFTLTAAKPTTLLFHLEEAGGGKYNATVSADGTKSVTLALSDFTAGDDSKDANGKLDMDQVTQIGLLDLSGLLENTPAQDNTLTVSDLRALK